MISIDKAHWHRANRVIAGKFDWSVKTDNITEILVYDYNSGLHLEVTRLNGKVERWTVQLRSYVIQWS